MSVLIAAIVPHPPLILPEIGRGEEYGIIKTQQSYREAMHRIAQTKPETVVLLSPHTTLYADYFHISPGTKAYGDFSRYRAKDVAVTARYDDELASAIADAAKRAGVPAGMRGERDAALDHATMIPLIFLAEQSVSCRVVRIGLSGLSPAMHYRLGRCIKKAAEALNRDVAIIASGDLSHKLLDDGPYGFSPEGPAFDQRVTKAMADGDFLAFLTMDPQLCESAAECGLGAFQIMAGTLDRMRVNSELLSYEGPFGVGYGVATFEPDVEDEARCFDAAYQRSEQERILSARRGEDAFVRLARETVERYVKTGETPVLPDDLPDEMTTQRAGVFVSLKIRGRLRGCIGTIEAVKGSIAEEIMQNAVSACSEDPRFEPVTKAELDSITYSVDVMGASERIDSMDQLDVKKYGVIVTSGYRKGLLLPNLDGVSTVREQVSIAKRKAGIPESERCRLERFEVVRHI